MNKTVFRIISPLLAACSFLMIAGCGSGIEEFPTAKAIGVVMCQGQPVPHAQIIFAPIADGNAMDAGKSGYAVADSEGKFVLTTYSNGDGAVVGKHNVIVDSPKAEEHPDFECDCETDARKNIMEVEVKEEGENNFTINLPEKPKRRRGKEKIDEDLDDILDED